MRGARRFEGNRVEFLMTTRLPSRRVAIKISSHLGEGGASGGRHCHADVETPHHILFVFLHTNIVWRA